MSEVYDVAVVGLGAIGGAAAAELAARGHRVLGLDRWRPPHDMGSSHGGTRMLREAYYEGSEYAPLARAARGRWTDLEARTGASLLETTGGLMIGPPGGAVFGGALFGGALQGGEHREFRCEPLDARDTRRRFPPFGVRDDEVVAFEPDAGILASDACLEALLSIASESGGDLRFGEPVAGWSVEGGLVRIRTSVGDRRARRLVLAAGAWMTSLSGLPRVPLTPERTIQFWFRPAEGADRESLSAPLCPLWVWEYERGSEWYGVPLEDGALKVGIHIRAGRETDPDGVDRAVSAEEIAGMRGIVERFMPAAAGELASASVCMYTNTPHRRFVIDRHPRHPEVALFAGGSGHAFKFAPVIGEILADLTEDADPAIDLSPFRVERFRSPRVQGT